MCSLRTHCRSQSLRQTPLQWKIIALVKALDVVAIERSSPTCIQAPSARTAGRLLDGGPVKDECLSKVILFGERSLRRALNEYVDHFHAQRNHQGRGDAPLFSRNTSRPRGRPVNCRGRLGGVLRDYPRGAAWWVVSRVTFLV